MGYVVADRVAESATVNGFSDFVLAGALPGRQSFLNAVEAGVFCYEAHAVNSFGAPSGDWEVGVGYFDGVSAPTMVQRLQVLDSSASTKFVKNKVDFAVGDVQISLTAPAATVQSERLASVVFYVRGDGNDGNSGLADSASGALRTIQAAVDAALSMATSSSIMVGSGDFISDGPVYIDSSDWCSVFIVGAGINQTLIDSVIKYGNGNAFIMNASLVPSEQNALLCSGAGAYLFAGQVGISGTINDAIATVEMGGQIEIGQMTLAGSAAAAFKAHLFGLATVHGPIALAADFLVSDGFIASPRGAGYIDWHGVTFDPAGHAVAGKAYSLSGNTVLNLNGDLETAVPGSLAGTAISGAQVI